MPWYLIDTVEGGKHWVKARALEGVDGALSKVGTWATGFEYTGVCIGEDRECLPASMVDEDVERLKEIRKREGKL